MTDSRPRLIKKSPPPLPAPSQRRQTRPRDQYELRRARRLAKLERHLAKYPDRRERQLEILPYFRAMLLAGKVRCRPVKAHHRNWIYQHPDLDIATLELFRLAYTQHCESVDWPALERP